MQRTQHVCENPDCKKIFLHYESNGAGKFCSKSCYWKMKSHGAVRLTCFTCGTEFDRQVKDARRSKKHYCSDTCRDEGMRSHGKLRSKNRLVVNCDYCNQTIERIPYRIKLSDKQFCNAECHAAWMHEIGPRGPDHHSYKRTSVECSNCGDRLTRESGYAKLYERFFCNWSCFGEWHSATIRGENHPGWKGGYPGYRGPNWHQQRATVIKRDENTCQRCGRHQSQLSRTLEVHHIVPFVSFGYIRDENDFYIQANDATNLVTLCSTCHRMVERQPRSD